MADYCDPADLYDYGVPRGALPNPGRVASSVSTSSNAFTLDVHGFAQDDPVSFRAEAGGSLPSPLEAGTTYYAIPLTDSTFSVATSEGGSAVDLTTAGSRVVVIAPLPIDKAIRWASRVIDDSLPAHVLPLTEPIHELVKMTCAELAAGKLAARSGSASKSLADIVEAAEKRLARWAKGIPLRGENAPNPANKAQSATVPYSDPRGWNRYGGL
jgi:hypothetical protein